MLRRPRALLAVLVLPVLVAGAFAFPAGGQAIPALPELPADLGELGDIDGLHPLDPVLAPVFDLVNGLAGAIDDLLADVPVVNTLQLGGKDAVEAAIAFSQATFPDGAETAVLARDDLFADGLSSGAFQGFFDAPLLLTGSGDLDERTAAELIRLGMDRVTILGGEDALHPVVVAKLEAAGLEVIRVDGPTRVETAVEAAGVTSAAATTAVLVRAYPDAGQGDDQAFADVLAAGPYAAENGWPILLTTSDALHPAVADYLAGSAVQDVVIIGGGSAVSGSAEGELRDMGLTTRRVAGANRYATAIAIAEARGFADSGDADRIILAESNSRADVWAPGFAASSHGDRNRAPVILANGLELPAESLEFILNGLSDNLTDGGAALVCAPFVSPVVCEAAGLLLIGNLTDAVDLLDIVLEDLPNLGDLLDALGVAGLLPEELQALIDQVDAVVDEVGGTVGDVVDDLLGGGDGGLPEVPVDPVPDVDVPDLGGADPDAPAVPDVAVPDVAVPDVDVPDLGLPSLSG